MKGDRNRRISVNLIQWVKSLFDANGQYFCRSKVSLKSHHQELYIRTDVVNIGAQSK